jgi:hypothetical protein
MLLNYGSNQRTLSHQRPKNRAQNYVISEIKLQIFIEEIQAYDKSKKSTWSKTESSKSHDITNV